MATKISFYLTQSLKYLNRSKLPIITLALAVSMIAGFGYYFDSAQNYILNESYTNIFDLGYELNNNNDHDLSFNLYSEQEQLQQTIMNSNLSPLNSVFYRSVDSDKFKILPSSSSQSTNLTQILGLSVKWLFLSNNFHQLARMKDYIHLDAGNWPNSTNDILIEKNFGNNYQYSIESNQSLKIRIGIANRDFFSIQNYNVVGYYSIQKSHVDFGETEIVSSDYETTFFSGSDFSKIGDYPNNNFIEPFTNQSEVKFLNNYGFETSTYLGITYDRKSVNLAWLSSSSKSISSKFNDLNKDVAYPVIAKNYISKVLAGQYKFQSDIRLAVQFTNIPLLLFTIYLASIANKTGAKKRYHEFFTMRMRGFPKKMIRRQLISESLINSLFVGILGSIIGVGIFYFIQNWFNTLFLSTYNLSGFSLSFSVSSTSIVTSFLFAGVISFFSSITTIIYINKLETKDLSSEVNNQSGEVDYDESNLYLNTSKSKNKESVNTQELEIENFTKSKTELIPKWGLWLAIAGFIPVILLGFVLLGNIPNAADNLIEISKLLQSHLDFLMILVFLSPFVFIVGILRFLLVESPPRYAKIVRFLSSPVLKIRSYFAGVEIVRQKQFYRIIMITGIFIALFGFSNITVNSLSTQSQYIENFNVGSDLNVKFDVNTRYVKSFEDLHHIENNFKNLTINSQEKIVQDMTRVLLTDKVSSGSKENHFYTLNLSKYISIIDSNNKFLPNWQFKEKIQQTIDYNEGLDQSSVGVIVSRSYLAANNLHLGENFAFIYSYQTDNILAGKVVAVMDTMPGLYKDNLDGDGYIVIDNHVTNESHIIYAEKVIELINLKDPEYISLQTLDSNLLSSAGYRLDSFIINKYNFDWQKASILSYQFLNIPFINLLYYNLIIIGAVLAFGVAILSISAQDENISIYGELLARGYGRQKLKAMISMQVFVSFFISMVVGLFSGFLSGLLFSKIFYLKDGGGFINYPIAIGFPFLLIVFVIIIGITYLLMKINLWKYSKMQISDFLEDDA